MDSLHEILSTSRTVFQVSPGYSMAAGLGGDFLFWRQVLFG